MAKVIESSFTKKQKERVTANKKRVKEHVEINKKRYERLHKIHKGAKKESKTPGYYAGARGTKGSPGAIAQLVVKGRPKLAKKGWK